MEDKEVVETPPSENIPPKKKGLTKQQKKYIFFVLLILVVTGLTIYSLLKDNFFDVIDTIKNANVLYILAMVGIILGVFIVEGFILTVFARLYKRKYRVYQGVFNGLIGTFFCDITPFASGGQFVQAYTFSRQGVKVANSASILVMHFIVYQSIIIIYGAVAFMAGYQSTIKIMGNVTLFGSLTFSPISLSVIGFLINIFTIVSLFVLAYCKPLHRIILNSGINLLAKMKILKNPEKKRQDLTVQVATFRIELKRLMSNIWTLVIVVVLMVIKMTLLYSLPYFAGLAVGNDMSGKFFQSLWSTSYLTMITCFIPIPGASGGAELAYQMLFSHMYTGANAAALINASNLLWRGISFYLGLIIGALVFMLYHESPKSYAIKADTRTFIDLEIVAMAKNSKEAETYEMLSEREEKHRNKVEEERKRNFKLLDADEVEKSFENINNIIMSNTVESVDDSIDEKTYEETKKYLKRVIEETNQQEESIKNEKEDPAVLEAIKEDSDALKKAQDKKLKKEEKKEEKKGDKQ